MRPLKDQVIRIRPVPHTEKVIRRICSIMSLMHFVGLSPFDSHAFGV